MSADTYAAHVGTEWRDFTPQHRRTLEQALAIALGSHSVPAGAVVGVYGSGKSTLLFSVLARAAKEGVLPIWEEASTFLDRLVKPDERIGPQELVTRVHGWVESLRIDSNVFASYKRDLDRRQLGAVATVIEDALRQPADRVVLLLDEMEQAYPHFLQRIDTADHQPLRALIDSCGNSRVRLLMAYAPESFHALGDADRGRMLRLAVPSLDATSIQTAFGLTKGEANFAWWASRGRSRGVLKAVEEVIKPHRSGQFDGSWLGLAQALDALPPVFGVPAVLRADLSVDLLPTLLDLIPHPDDGEARCDVIDTRDRSRLATKLLEALASSSRARREDVEIVVAELLEVLDGVSDAEHQCFLNFDDFSVAVNLAVARAVESGRLTERIEGLEAGRAFYQVAARAEPSRLLPFSLHRLADEIFPSPFTDPVLPLGDGRLVAQSEVDQLFAQLAGGDPILRWEERGCVVFRDMTGLEKWLEGELARQDESTRWRALLLDEGQQPGRLVSLAREAGRVELKALSRFHACFIKCLALRARQGGLGDDMKQVGAAVRATDRQLGRKADWHLGRIGRLLEEIEPIPQRQWQGALRAARNENLTVVLGRLGEDSPGLLALLHLFKPYRPETRKVLAELSEILADNSELRKLAKAGEKRFEGAAVVVDELLPRRTKSTTRQRWVDADFSGRDDLRAILEAFASSDHAAVLGKLLNPQAAARMERLIRFYAGELPDLRPERQQLDALRGISDVMRRVKLVHKGIQALLGTRDEVRGLVIGQLISQAFAAQKSIDAFNRLGPRLERIEEPWAKALALWVASVFAERVWYGVEHDEAALKMWETLAERGKELGRAIDERIEELRSMGLESAADFLSIERARLKAAISDIDQMLAKMDEIRTTDDQFEGLAEALKEFKELAADRGVAISDLLETYRPEARRIPDEQGLVEHTTNLLRSIEDPWPASGSEDLREYLRRLRAFAEQSHADRLRGRLAEVVGLSLISKGVVLDKDDVAEIEEGWPKLSQEFAGACRDAIEMTPQAGSEKLRVWVNEALDKQSCLAEWPGLDAPRFASLDIKVREWATRVTVRPSQVAEAGAFRSRAQQLLTNLSRCVAPTVIDELLNVAEGAAAGEAYATLEREMQEFQREVEALAQSFREVVGPSALRWPYPGATRAAVCAELDASRRTAEDKREELHHRIQSLNGVIEQLGGRPRLIPSPPTVPDAQNIAATALAEAAGLLDSAWRTLFERLRHLGFDSVFSGRVTGSAPEEDQSSLDTARRWCGLVEEEARALEAMGLHFPEVTDKTPEAALEDFRLAVAQGEVELRNANERVRMLRSRLERLGCEDETSDVSPFTMLGDAKEAQRQLEAAIEEVRTRRLGKASEDAQRVYRALLAGDETHYGDVPPSIRELRRLGLLCTIEDNE